MLLTDRIESFKKLGAILRKYPETKDDALDSILLSAARKAEAANLWFTREQIDKSFHAIGESLREKNIDKWLVPYLERIQYQVDVQTVAVVMAGNIPAVGFHDFLCVLMSGNRLLGKLSSQDDQLLPAFASVLTRLNNEWERTISWTTEKLTNFDSIIATGSSNSARYFNYYFRNYPHLIRKNRNGIAILTGEETTEEITGLALDIMSYFGLGCRNVSKLYIPGNYDFLKLSEAIGKYSHYTRHDKYRNNYDYQKSCFLINKTSFIDTGSLLLVPCASFSSPVAVVHFEEYSQITEICDAITDEMESIQCIVCNFPLSLPHVAFGKTQSPELWDYADSIDTMDFLLPKLSAR